MKKLLLFAIAGLAVYGIAVGIAHDVLGWIALGDGLALAITK